MYEIQYRCTEEDIPWTRSECNAAFKGDVEDGYKWLDLMHTIQAKHAQMNGPKVEYRLIKIVE